MPGYDPRFWELPVDPDTLSWMPDLSGAPDEGRTPAGERAFKEAMATLAELVHTHLTDRQRQLVELYFYEHLTQQEISARLGVSQQAVSRQLFGVVRQGRKVGGAVQRLRVLCGELGIDPGEWV
jgi:RNA polymerase sigma factor (sigma-70 family)